MVVSTKINAERVYYNYEGNLPPVTLEPDPVSPPSMQDDLPKLPAGSAACLLRPAPPPGQRHRHDLRGRGVHLPEARCLDAREAAGARL